MEVLTINTISEVLTGHKLSIWCFLKHKSTITYINTNQVLRVNKNTLKFGANLILLNLTMNVVAYHFPLCDKFLAGI